MARLLLFAVILALAGTATAGQPEESGTPLEVKIDGFKLCARSLEVKARSSDPNGHGVPVLNCSLRGEASFRIGDFSAHADQVQVAVDEQKDFTLHMRGDCRLKYGQFQAVADCIELTSPDRILLIVGDDNPARLTYGKDEKATTLEASTIRFNSKTRQVQMTDGMSVKFGE